MRYIFPVVDWQYAGKEKETGCKIQHEQADGIPRAVVLRVPSLGPKASLELLTAI
jgi:hypothetical protein